MLGLALEADRQHERSIEELAAASARNRADDRAPSALAEVLLRLERPADAERVLRDELDAVPGSGIARYQLATLLSSSGRTAEAITVMERAAASAPAIGQDYLYDTLGTLYIGDANLAGALGAYRRRVLFTSGPSSGGRGSPRSIWSSAAMRRRTRSSRPPCCSIPRTPKRTQAKRRSISGGASTMRPNNPRDARWH